ncbi:MAG TPA: hypothetical protein VJ991_12885 [Balneolales bacterium]|nr:hypothetical protein [Balneolales bacterium]
MPWHIPVVLIEIIGGYKIIVPALLKKQPINSFRAVESIIAMNQLKVT